MIPERRWVMCVGLLCAGFLGAPSFAILGHAEPPANPWYVAHTFTGEGACLQVEKGRRLAEGDSVLVFEVGKPPARGRISYLIDVAAAETKFKRLKFDGVYRNKALWDSIGCYWGFRSGTAVGLARVILAAEEHGVLLALKDLPAKSVVVGSVGAKLDWRGLDSIAIRVGTAVPAEYLREGNLRAGLTYDAGHGHEIVEAFLGRPFYNTRGGGAPIDSIHICRIFLYDGQMLGANFMSRVSGEEERVDTEAPQLDETNWFETQEETMGFISLDGGATWDWLSQNIGFEGFDWTIVRLVEGLPQQWGDYLYTLH